MPEIPIEVSNLSVRLRADFTGKLTESVLGTAAQREANFLSRALAALTIAHLGAASLDEAAQSVVDGERDGGIDAIWFAPATRVLWVVQSKFHTSGHGEPDLGDVTKFKVGLENLLHGRFGIFERNIAWRPKLPLLQSLFASGSIVVRAVLAYSGIHLISEDRRWLFEDLLRQFSAQDDFLRIHVCNLTTIDDWLVDAEAIKGVRQVEFVLRKPGWLTDHYETVYGLLPLGQLAELYRTHGDALIAANIRAYKGDTEVNARIAATVREEPEHFLYLNNGLTAYCSRFVIHGNDRGNYESKRITAHDFSIVNGAQTLGTLSATLGDAAGAEGEGLAFLKVISLQNCEDERTFAHRITHSTNFQNQIGPRDFVALDPQQERIESHLRLAGIAYHYKDGVDVPAKDETNFTLDEATTACATLVQRADGDFCARVLANRKSLWSFDVAGSSGPGAESRYQQVFPESLSARTVWRAVQAQRVILAALRSNETGVRKEFFENGRWLIMNLLFLKHRPQDGDALTLTPDECASLTIAAQQYAEILWSTCVAKGLASARTGGGWESLRHFRSIFSAPGDCSLLRGAALAALASSQPVMRNGGVV